MMKVPLLTSILFCSIWCFSQKSYQYSLSVSPETCVKGSASLEIKGTEEKDSLLINWSNGSTNTLTITQLESGDYFVQTEIIHHQNNSRFVNDTNLVFKVEKEICGVSVDTYFSPNEDGYHDLLGIINVNYYPNFEFVVFNKWGQQIHNQKNNYKPWDGKWNGVEVPDGSYYYIFFFDAANRSNMVKGNVTIIR